MSRFQACLDLIEKHYSDVPMKDAVLKTELDPLLGKDVWLLDAGCGSQMEQVNRWQPHVGVAVGVELDPALGKTGAAIPVRASMEALPFTENSYDVIVSREVCEHLPDPVRAFNELKRVVKPDGRILIVTPNKYEYFSIISRLLPTKLKELFLSRVFGEDAYDNFPTYYRVNTPRAIRKVAAASRLEIEKLIPIRNYPYYLMFSKTLFYLGILLDKAVARLRLTSLYSSVLAVLKPMEQQDV
jgi:SAM-dependent methyltransferase